MPSRKKRLRKGIESIGEQIKLHKEKRDKAEKEGKIELKEYYEKEILELEKTKEHKEEMLEKQ